MTHDLSNIRKEFPILSQEIEGYPLTYLDSAATAQKPQCVINAMSEFYEKDNANVKRGMHELAERSTEIYEAARTCVQQFLNAKSAREIIFTKNTTEGVNLVARSWGEANLQKGDVVVLSLLEHHSNIVPWLQLKEKIGIEVQWIGIEKDGTIKKNELISLLASSKCKLVSISCVSNVLGTITPYKEIVKLAHEHGALCLLDAAQLSPHRRINVQDSDCDFLVFSGHKVYGPTGIGVLYGKEELLNAMPPFLGGGTMIQEVFTDHFVPTHLPDKFEAGTPPIAEARGLHAALDWLSEIGWDAIQKHEQELLSYALEKLSELPFVEVLGPKDPAKICSCISFVCHAEPGPPVPDRTGRSTTLHPHDLTEYMGRKGVCLRAGHHCAQPLHDFLGIPATTRLSVAVYNTKEDIDRMCNMMKEAHEFFVGTTSPSRLEPVLSESRLSGTS